MDWILDWTTKINMRFVRFAMKLLLKYPVDYQKDKQIIDRAIKNEDGYYDLNDACVKGFTENYVKNEDKGAIFCFDDMMLALHYSSYRVRFSVPKTCLISYETEELEIPQTITINEWAYENCYLRSINRILEDHGKNLNGILFLDDNISVNCNSKSNPNYEIIELLKNDVFRENLKIVKKKLKIEV